MSGGGERFVSGELGSPRKSNEGLHWSNSPKSSPRNKPRRTEESDAKKMQQKQAYVAWTNSQLKKLPKSKLVDDLARDMQDGVALAQLIEVVAGEKISINLEPSSPTEMKENVEKILLFTSARKIRLHHVTSKDIVNGNLKAIMRLILALAAHFKPSSVRTPVSEPRLGRRVRRTESSLSAVAADAAATLHDVSRAAASVGTPYGSRFRSKLFNSSPSTSSIDSNEKDVKVLSNSQSMSGGSSNAASATQGEKVVKRGDIRRDMSTKSDTSLGKKPKRIDGLEKRLSDGGDSGEGKKSGMKKRITLSCSHWKEIVEGYNMMEGDVRETRKNLLHLQDVLLNQEIDDQGITHELSSLDSTLLQEQVTILNARLDQRSSEYDEVKNELHRTREECINLEGIKQGLQCRLSDQEQVMMKLKAELLKLTFSHEAANSEKTELQNFLDERDRELALLRSEIQTKDNQLEIHKEKLETALVRAADVDTVESDLRAKIRKHEAISGALRTQVKELQQKLRSVGESEVKLSKRITYQDRKVSLLEDKLLRDQGKPKADEIDAVRQCVRKLRNSFPAYDPQHDTLDTLQETLTNMLDCDFVQYSVNDVCKVTSENNNYQNGISPRQEKDEIKSPHIPEVNPVTRITFFQPNGATPSVTTIAKRLGEVTLGDFKTLIASRGKYRYYFKALDPEFGTIREELVNDNDVIPGWDNKIMAWITEWDGEVGSYHGNSGSHKRSETDI